MSRWAVSAKWAEGPALAAQRDMPLALRLSEGLGVTADGLNLSVVEALKIAVPTFIMKFMFDEVSVGVFSDDEKPELSSRFVQGHLPYLPFATKLIKDEVRRLSANTDSAVFLHDEELAHPEVIPFEAYVRID